MKSTWLLLLQLVTISGVFDTFVYAGSREYDVYRSIAESGNVEQIKAAITVAESFWPADIGRYCECANGLVIGLQTARKMPASMPLLGTVVTSALSKAPEEMPKGARPSLVLFTFQMRAAEILLAVAQYSSSSGEERMRYAEATESFLIRLNKELITDYKPRWVTANVAPPIGSGFQFAGMNPEGIKDPVARAAYINAIEKNAQNNALNALQSHLRHIIPIVDFALARFLQNTIAKCPEVEAPSQKMLERTITNSKGPDYLPKSL